MTVTNEINRWELNGDGASTAFSITNKIFTKNDLEVFVDDALQTVDTDYTVSGFNDPTGATVTFTSAPPSGTKNVVIVSKIDAEQATKYPNNDEFPSTAHEKALDKAMRVAQQNKVEIGRAVRLDDSDTSGADMKLPALASRKDKVMGFHATTGAPEMLPKDDVAGLTIYYLGAFAADPSTRNDGSALVEGDLYWNTGSDRHRTWDGTAWVDSNLAGRDVFVYTATGGETSLSGADDNGNSLTYTAGLDRLAVFKDTGSGGVLLQHGTDYTATTGSSITGLTALSSGDVVTIVNYVSLNASEVSDVATVAGISADVTTVAGVDSDVTTVAGISANVTTVAGISADVTTVAGISGDVTTVAGISANVTTVAGISADVTTVAGDSTDVQLLADIQDGTTATNAITDVAAIDSDVTTVAGVSADVTTVAGISDDVSSVAAQAVGWTFDMSTTMADPGSGDIRLNNATLASVTAIAVDALDMGGADISDFVATWDDSTNTVKGHITLRKGGDATTFAVYSISSVTDNTGWLQIDVSHVDSAGSFSASDDVFVGFSRSGDAGAMNSFEAGDGLTDGGDDTVTDGETLTVQLDGTTLTKSASGLKVSDSVVVERVRATHTSDTALPTQASGGTQIFDFGSLIIPAAGILRLSIIQLEMDETEGTDEAAAVWGFKIGTDAVVWLEPDDKTGAVQQDYIRLGVSATSVLQPQFGFRTVPRGLTQMLVDIAASGMSTGAQNVSIYMADNPSGTPLSSFTGEITITGTTLTGIAWAEIINDAG